MKRSCASIAPLNPEKETERRSVTCSNEIFHGHFRVSRCCRFATLLRVTASRSDNKSSSGERVRVHGEDAFFIFSTTAFQISRPSLRLSPRLFLAGRKKRRMISKFAGSGCRACGSPGALVLRPSGKNVNPSHGAKNSFAPTARKRGLHYLRVALPILNFEHRLPRVCRFIRSSMFDVHCSKFSSVRCSMFPFSDL